MQERMADNDKTGSIICDNFTRTFSKKVYLGDELCLTPPLKSLEEYNTERRALYAQRAELNAILLVAPWPLSGIACPECGAELTNKAMSGTFIALDHSRPPEKRVGCPECDYHGFRVA